MFDNSSNICMYCGELSVLRNGFYSHFENMEDAEKVKGALIDSFTHFLNCNGTSLSIVLENYRDFGFKDLICKEVFEKKMKEGNGDDDQRDRAACRRLKRRGVEIFKRRLCER